MPKTIKTAKKAEKKPYKGAKRGPKPWIPSQDDIKKIGEMKAAGATLQGIANAFGVGFEALNNRRKEMPELDEAIKAGKRNLDNYVVGKLKMLIDNDLPSAIFFYLKTQAGYSEKVAVNHTADMDLNFIFEDQAQTEG